MEPLAGLGLPWWMVALPWVLWPAAAAVLGAAGPAAVAALELREARALPAEAHWTLRARAHWPWVRRRALGVVVGVGAALCALVPLTTTGDLWPPARSLAVLGAGVLGALGMDARVRAGVPVPGTGWRGGLALTALLHGPLLGVLVLLLGVVAGALPAPLAVALGVLSLEAWFRGLGLGLGRALGVLRPLGAPPVPLPAGGPPARWFLLDTDHANAFALAGAGAIVLTRGLLARLPPAAVAAVIGHERHHLAEGRSARRRLLPLVPVAGLPLVVALARDGAPLGALGALGAIAVLVLLLARRARAHAHAAEHAADGHTESSPADMAAALEAIYAANLLPAVLGPLRRAHPDLVDRLAALGAPPTWPVPPPPRPAPTLLVGLGAAALCLALPVATLGLHVLVLIAPGPRAAGALAILLGGPAPLLSHAAVAADAARGPDAALPWARATCRAADPTLCAVWVDHLLAAGDCPGAAQALRAYADAGADPALDPQLSPLVPGIRACASPHAHD